MFNFSYLDEFVTRRLLMMTVDGPEFTFGLVFRRGTVLQGYFNSLVLKLYHMFLPELAITNRFSYHPFKIITLTFISLNTSAIKTNTATFTSFIIQQMGITQIRKYCLQGQEEQQKPNHYEIIANNYKAFQNDRWYTFQNPILFDPKKFIFLYPNYQEEQSQLIRRWKATIDIKTIEYGQSRNDEDVVSTRWKYAIKRGVPIEYYKTIISVIFNKNFNSLKPFFDKIKSQINFNEPLPLFGAEEASIREAVNAPFLNEKGVKVLKQLMYLFKKKKGQIFYNRYIGHVTAILLIFFEDYQAYELVSTMMDQSSNMSLHRSQSFRWHMVFKQGQMKNLAQSFYRIAGNNSETISKLQKYCDKNAIDKVKLFNRIIQSFFYGYLPFPFILRIFMLFLNEGVKILFRIFYAMIVLSQSQLIEVTSLEKALLVIKKKCLNISTAESITILKKSFNLNLKATISTKLIESRLKREQSQRKYYYLPFIKGASNILSFDDLQVIWGFLPFELKPYDLQLKFPPKDSSAPPKLKILLESLQAQRFNLILIKTTTSNVFGYFFIDSLKVEASPTWYGSNQNFLFTLAPKATKYSSQRENNHYLFIGEGQLKVGSGGNGNALLLQQDLSTGQTYKSNTFRNEALNNEGEGKFQIEFIQAFTLY